jgi:hypothetical protein
MIKAVAARTWKALIGELIIRDDETDRDYQWTCQIIQEAYAFLSLK